jgi:NtrC-family two-component system response regulator AlgB
MQRTLQSAERAAASDATILLIGESGTGKSLLARQIHLWSPRRAKPFLTIDCAALPQQTHGAEGSGWNFNPLPPVVKRGSGKLGALEDGTLFLANIDDLPPPLQVELARFIQNRTIETPQGEKINDLRIIAASSRDLVPEVKMHRFREDLFYNLNIISLRIPPLRERLADIRRPLALRMLAAAAIRHRRGELYLSQEAVTALVQYRWPGNVRELQNAMESAAVLCQGETITLANLPEAASKHLQHMDTLASKPSLDEMERQHILRVLSLSPTLEQAATTLSINVSTLWRKRKRFSLNVAIASKSRRTLT